MKIIAFAFLVAMSALGQEPQAKIEFEVASIKPSEPLSEANATQVGMFVDGASVRIIGAPLITLIGRAYRLDTNRIDISDSLKFSRFDIFAKIPQGVAQDQVPEMLQSLLRERFALAAHFETRVKKGYVLTAKDPRLLTNNRIKDSDVPVKPGLSFRPSPGGDKQAVFTSVSLDRFARGLEGTVGAPVTNDTKTEGTYNLVIHSSDDSPGYAMPLADVLSSLAEQGLAMRTSSFELQYLIVDRINKVPTAN